MASNKSDISNFDGTNNVIDINYVLISLKKYINSLNKSFISKIDINSDVINLKDLEVRESILDEMKKIKNNINDIITLLNNSIVDATNKNKVEISRMDVLLSRMKGQCIIPPMVPPSMVPSMVTSMVPSMVTSMVPSMVTSMVPSMVTSMVPPLDSHNTSTKITQNSVYTMDNDKNDKNNKDIKVYDGNISSIPGVTRVSSSCNIDNTRISMNKDKTNILIPRSNVLINQKADHTNMKIDINNNWNNVMGRNKYRQISSISSILPFDYNTKNTSQINIIGSLTIDAIKVPNFNLVLNDGNLYYIESANHFAFRICGLLFHGNIGFIYTNGSDPEKIKNCRFGKGCMKSQCNYYHNPIIYDNSKDIRNFIANSWLYAPATALYKYKKKSRHFGSRNTLESDLYNMNDEEVERFIDQSVHDLLCGIILRKYYISILNHNTISVGSL